MDRPNVTHAGCGGNLFRSESVLLCERCHLQIEDPRELTPRPRVEVREPQNSHLLLRTYLERRSRYLTPQSFEVR